MRHIPTAPEPSRSVPSTAPPIARPATNTAEFFVYCRSQLPDSNRRPAVYESVTTAQQGARQSQNRGVAGAPSGTDVHGGPPSEPKCGPASGADAGSADSVEVALGRAVLLAAQAGEWRVAAELGRELAARRLEREPRPVAVLERGRRAREGGP
jgi:hypothetical protein